MEMTRRAFHHLLGQLCLLQKEGLGNGDDQEGIPSSVGTLPSVRVNHLPLHLSHTYLLVSHRLHLGSQQGLLKL
jgi:hypothetical protein